MSYFIPYYFLAKIFGTLYPFKYFFSFFKHQLKEIYFASLIMAYLHYLLGSHIYTWKIWKTIGYAKTLVFKQDVKPIVKIQTEN